MIVTVYAPGLTVEVFDKTVTPTGGTGGTGATGSTGSTGSTGGTAPVIPAVVIEPMISTALVALNGFVGTNSNYERFQTLQEAAPAVVSLPFGCKNAPAARRLLGPSYTLQLYAMPANTLVTSFVCNVAPNSVQSAAFSANLTGYHGWYRAKIVCPPGESAPSWFIHVNGGGAPATLMPACSGSYDLMHSAASHKWAMVPAVFAPKAKPLPARVREPFATTLPPSQIHREYLVPCKGDMDIHRSVVSPSGVTCTFNYQSYAWSTLVAKFPFVSLLDGPRGIGTLAMPTHLQVGRNEKVYFMDSWRFGVIDKAGTITTLCGWRHSVPPGQYRNDATALTLVGNWAAVDDKGTREAWGGCFDPDSTKVDLTVPPVGNPPEPPHVGIGPVWFLADTQKNRVLKYQFNGGGDAGLAVFGNRDRGAPCIVTVFIANAADAFDVQCESDAEGGNLYVSERGAHRIAAYDKNTGAFRRVVASGAALSSVDASRAVVRHAPLATIQAEDCVGPEGLSLRPGKLKFGSLAMAQVKEIDLVTNALRVVCAPTLDTNSRFIKVAESDGTTGPVGTTFVTTWSSGNYGVPEAFLPNGTKWNIQNFFTSDSALSQGRGGSYEAMGYGAAVGCGLGMIVFATSMEGVAVITKAQPSDPAPNYALYKQGAQEWSDQGLHLTHEHRNFGYYGLPDPVGRSAAIDYYIGVNY